jgi:hypothetical protein
MSTQKYTKIIKEQNAKYDNKILITITTTTTIIIIDVSLSFRV